MNPESWIDFNIRFSLPLWSSRSQERELLFYAEKNIPFDKLWIRGDGLLEKERKELSDKFTSH